MISRNLCSFIWSTLVAPSDPEHLLQYHRTLRDIGTYILLGGVILEILIDHFWEIPTPPLLRGRKATQLIKTPQMRLKGYAMLFAGLGLVGGGIWLELWQGQKADDTADRIRYSEEARIRSLSVLTAATTLVASGRAAQLVNRDMLFKSLAPFKGIVKVSIPPSQNIDEETLEFFFSFRSMIDDALGQKPRPPKGIYTENPNGESDVKISFHDSTPPLPFDAQAKKAAQAIAIYLFSVGIKEMCCWPMTPNLQPGEVLITIGKRTRTLDHTLLLNLERTLDRN
jgi:hypothetical protein